MPKTSRRHYKMSKKEVEELKRASKQIPWVENEANLVWKKISNRLGFRYETARPLPNKGERFFTATPLENEQNN